MKAFKAIFIGIISIVVILLIVTFFLPSTLHVEKSLEMKASPKLVFDQISHLPNWEGWSPWQKLDTNMTIEYGDLKEGEGAYYSWVSEMGDGKITISKSIENEKVEYDMEFDGRGGSKSAFIIEENDGKTKLIWTFDGEFSFFERWAIVLGAKSMLEESYEEGLKNIKNIVESMKDDQIEIVVKDIEGFPFLAVADSLSMDQMGMVKEKMTSGFGEIMGYMQGNNIRLDTNLKPIAVTDQWSQNKWVFKCGVPVSTIENLTPSGRVVFDSIPATKVVMGIYIGPYEKAEPAYNQVMEFMKESNLEQAGRPWEAYLNDPENTPPEKLVTHIYFPVKN